MKINYKIGFLFLILSFFLIRCKKSDSASTANVVCTTEYRTITIQVLGTTLDHFYTIRVNTGDTIHFNTANTLGANYFPVIDDSYQNKIANHTEQFRFVGIKSNNVVVNEFFYIKADLCHVEYVSGNTIVYL